MIDEKFFNKDVVSLAKDLLGCELVHKTPMGVTAGVIVETEAYHQTDEASHSFKGKTARTAAMFGPPGRAYIYFTYGMHWCFNITAEADGTGAGVLIRALEPTRGIELMARRRGGKKLHELCSGPSKLAQAMGISRADYGKPVFMGEFGLVQRSQAANLSIRSGPRIGISKAKDANWRFWIKDNDFVSRKVI
ncbi:MAG TPA: DNA-3-methyladenine glycosylase [Candidatus Saccharimonadales bacterium]|nr:DNA-3-methyladenine glycosylase [Candidatus Saccharimonadales bacterium]